MNLDDALATTIIGQAETRIRLDRIEQKLEIIMSGLTDLNANIAALQAEWTTFLADMQQALSNSDSDAAVEAAAQLVAQQTAALQANDPVTNPPAASTTPPASGTSPAGTTTASPGGTTTPAS